MRRIAVTGAAWLLSAACASIPPEEAARRQRVVDAAGECKPQFANIARYELDYFGRLIAYYWDNRPQSEVEPFFDCVRQKLR